MVNFGTALFNGLPQPRARGVTPEMDLGDNRELQGTATWEAVAGLLPGVRYRGRLPLRSEP